MVKLDPVNLSISEFRVVYILAKEDLAINAYEIHRKMIRLNLDFFDAILSGEYSFKVMNWDDFIAMFVSFGDIVNYFLKVATNPTSKTDKNKMRDLLNEGDVKSIRKCEKMLRNYFEDFPSVERITRILKNLEKEGYVNKRAVGGREIVWSIPSEFRDSIFQHAKRMKKTRDKELQRVVNPIKEILKGKKEPSRKPLS